jgi:hypothetical protein
MPGHGLGAKPHCAAHAVQQARAAQCKCPRSFCRLHGVAWPASCGYNEGAILRLVRLVPGVWFINARWVVLPGMRLKTLFRSACRDVRRGQTQLAAHALPLPLSLDGLAKRTLTRTLNLTCAGAQADRERFAQMDAGISGHGAETVYRDKEGRRVEGPEALAAAAEAEKPKHEKPAWGGGIAQARAALAGFWGGGRQPRRLHCLPPPERRPKHKSAACDCSFVGAGGQLRPIRVRHGARAEFGMCSGIWYLSRCTFACTVL